MRILIIELIWEYMKMISKNYNIDDYNDFLLKNNLKYNEKMELMKSLKN
ncbi:hypothetical protein [Haliovirga abyssi]|nr:hypothetical protein [Haliovirga abyssi]